MINYNEQDKIRRRETCQLTVYNTEEEFWTKGKEYLEKCSIDTEAAPDNTLYITFSSIYEDTKIKDYSDKFNIKPETQSEELPCRIISISDAGDVIIDMYTKNGKIPKRLKEYYVSILKEMNLLYTGAEFLIVYDKILNGMQVRIEDYTSRNIKADSWYEELINSIEKKC